MYQILIYGSESLPESADGDEEGDMLVTCNMAEAKKRLISEDYMMIIIDLEGREKKGMQLAEFVRQLPRQCMTPILFLAKNRSQEWRAFHEIHCYDYIVKPLTPSQMFQIFFLYMKRVAYRDRDEPIVFSVGPERFPVFPEDILYLESCNRMVTVYTTTVSLKVPSLKLKEFIAQYGDRFIQIRRGLVVNRDQIRCIDYSSSQMELKTDNIVLYIGKTYIAAVRKAFDERNRK